MGGKELYPKVIDQLFHLNLVDFQKLLFKSNSKGVKIIQKVVSN